MLARRSTPKLAALSAALIVLAALLTLDDFERRQAMQEQRLHIMERASALDAKLEAAVSKSAASTGIIASIFATRPELSQAEFIQLAGHAKTLSPDILNLALIRGTVVNYAYPQAGNEKFIGLDYRQLPAQWPSYQKMMDTRQAVTAGPLELVQGGMAVVVRVPVYHTDPESGEEQFLGAVSAPVLFEALLREAELPTLEQTVRVAIRGRDGQGGTGEIIYGNPALFNEQPVLRQVTLPGGSWEIAATPLTGWGSNTTRLWIIRTLGGLLCILAALMAYAMVRHLQQRAENENQLKRRGAELVHQNAVLEMITHHAALPDILETLTQLVELHNPDMLCAIQLLDRDGKHLCHGVAPSLPDFFNQALDGLAIGEAPGACGMAVSRGERVIVEDMHTHPYPEDFRALVVRAGLQSCWAQPIKDHDGRVLGTFAVYQRHPAPPQPAEITLIENYAALAALAIERTQTTETLRLHDAALNVAASAISIADRQAHIVWANPAFTRLTGYGLNEAVGRTYGELLRSGLHGDEFYRDLWQSILAGRVWHGELTNRRKDGSLYHDETTITPVRDQSGEITHFVTMRQDVTERKIAEEQLKNLAFYDPLTQLPNRRLLLDRLGLALAISKRSGRYGALMFLDLDNFKPLNDQHGHDIGDLLLMEAARRIVHCVREEDTVARFGGDEFVVMLKELDTDRTVSADHAHGVAEKIRAAIGAPYRLELLQAENGNTAIEHHCTTSIGIVMFLDHESAREDLLKWADIGMYQAKAAGRDTIRFYEPGNA
ncbi:MAG TPA: diguanylate cyclase [Gallionella sp.]|nr:diguanylate cyclase [Gallionella sp.]